jgi:hypothetical protein
MTRGSFAFTYFMLVYVLTYINLWYGLIKTGRKDGRSDTTRNNKHAYIRKQQKERTVLLLGNTGKSSYIYVKKTENLKKTDANKLRYMFIYSP